MLVKEGGKEHLKQNNRMQRLCGRMKQGMFGDQMRSSEEGGKEAGERIGETGGR